MNTHIHSTKDYFIHNAIENGWTIKKIDTNKYEFTISIDKVKKGHRKITRSASDPSNYKHFLVNILKTY